MNIPGYDAWRLSGPEEHPDPAMEPCLGCYGRGYVRGDLGESYDCDLCDGTGEVEAEPDEPDGDYEYERRRDAATEAQLYRTTEERDLALGWRDHDKERAERAEAENTALRAAAEALAGALQDMLFNALHGNGLEAHYKARDKARTALAAWTALAGKGGA